MSGVMPAASNEKNGPVRPQPTWMSSTARRIPWRWHRSDSRRSQSAPATLMPPSAWIVSTMMSAGSSIPDPPSSMNDSR